MKKQYDDFVHYINTIFKDIQKLKTFDEKNLGLKSSQVMCLFYLGQSEGGLTSSELCEKCKEDKAAVSRNLAYLTERGYVTVQGDDSQKYKLRNVLTDDGMEAYIKLEDVMDGARDLFSKGISAREMARFYKTLDKLNANLEKFFNEKEKQSKEV